MSDLNDYLDERMDDGEREAFERRLVNDPALERRVKEAREIRDALREGDEELSPGFMTRTVARFEQEQRPRARLPFGLTWSTAGLAVAGLAAAAIFVPLMFRGELASQIEELQPPEPTELADVVPEEPGRGRGAGSDEAVRPSQDPIEGFSALGYVAGAEADGAAGGEQGDLAPAEDLREKVVRQAAASEPARAAPDAGEPKLKRKQDNAPAPRPVEVDAVPTYGASDKGMNFLSESRGVAAMTLPDGFVEPGTVAISGGASDQDSYTVHGTDDTRARERVDASGRFLVIGRHAGLDSFGELEMKKLPTYWEVTFDVSGSAEGSVECGLLLPADDLEIRFMGKPVDG